MHFLNHGDTGISVTNIKSKNPADAFWIGRSLVRDYHLNDAAFPAHNPSPADPGHGDRDSPTLRRLQSPLGEKGPSYEITPPSYPRYQRQHKSSRVETRSRVAVAFSTPCPGHPLALTSRDPVACAIPASGAGKRVSYHSQGTILPAKAHRARDISPHKG